MLVELCRYLFCAVVERPEEVRIDHIWTQDRDLLFVRLSSRDRAHLHPKDFAAIATVVERLSREFGREAVVDLR